MQPIHAEAGGGVPSSIRNARTIMYVQGALYIVSIVFGVLAAAARNRNNAVAQETADQARRGAGLFGLIVLVIVVALIASIFVYAGKLPSMRADLRMKVTVLESIIALLSVLALAGRNPFAIVALGLAVAVIVLLNKSETKEAFTTSTTSEAAASNRFEVRNFPQV